MSGLVFILVAAVLTIAVFDILAQVFGVDSRPELEDSHAPAPGLYS